MVTTKDGGAFQSPTWKRWVNPGAYRWLPLPQQRVWLDGRRSTKKQVVGIQGASLNNPEQCQYGLKLG